MEQIRVSLAERSYPITIGSGLFAQSTSCWPLNVGETAMIVTNTTLAKLYLPSVSSLLERNGVRVDNVILPDGEEFKTLTELDKIFTELLKKPHGRDTTLVALGGGVVGDMAGFAAACYQRGVRFIQMPTTLLAQVDSSVGGKTAVNHPLGKNMIGAFYQPVSVVIDTDCLATLPANQFASGLAEVIKYGIILDGVFFSWLEKNLDRLLALEPSAVAYCIRRCCELKAEVVAEDEHETGRRALLNLGHTYGHAIEAHMGYGCWLHGEAVAAGMVMAARTAEALGQFVTQDTTRIIDLIGRAGLPVKGPETMTASDYLPHMLRDKKVIRGNLRLVLPHKIGEAAVCTDIDTSLVLASVSV